MKRAARLFLTLSLLGLISHQASAQTKTIRVTGESGGAIPIALNGFTGEVLDVLQFDLFVQGFKIVPRDQSPYLISGSNAGNVRGAVTIAGTATVQGATAPAAGGTTTLLSKNYTGGSLRRQAHAFADDIVEAITKGKGIGLTRIAFKADTGKTSEIMIADFDGHNAQTATSDGSIVAAPSWVPGKQALYYTTYKWGGVDIAYHDLGSGKRNPVARYPGMNSSAAASPDGSKFAMVLSKGGSPDIYVASADGKNLVRLTNTKEDESSPCWSPDGKWICFAGKKDERRSLWKVPASGGNPVRISTGVSSPSEPDWSPDGKSIVFTMQTGRYFTICTVSPDGGDATRLVDGEDPSWAPNSRTVVFARRTSGGRRLSLLDVPTKQTKDIARISSSGSNSQPNWAK